MTLESRLQERLIKSRPSMCRNCRHTCRSGFSTCRRGSRLHPTCCRPTWSADLSVQVGPSYIQTNSATAHYFVLLRDVDSDCSDSDSQGKVSCTGTNGCSAHPCPKLRHQCAFWPPGDLSEAQATLLCLQVWNWLPPALSSFQMPMQQHSCLQHPIPGMPQRAQEGRQAELESSSRPLRRHHGLSGRPQGSAAPTSGRKTRRQGSWRPTR